MLLAQQQSPEAFGVLHTGPAATRLGPLTDHGPQPFPGFTDLAG
ncbi:MAG: hypothetical protein QOE15_2067, partial [Acidimicrobiaceae bacterium]|nr:hypothetical protein [Acidimicrobiaceae bacterium]